MRCRFLYANIFHYTLFVSWLETVYKSQITLAGKIRPGGDTICYSWFEFKFEKFDHLEITFNCSTHVFFIGMIV